MAISSALGSSALLPAGLGFRNMVINGGFTIDQRNNGAAQSGKTSDFYAVDRFRCSVNSSGNFTGQQVALSTLSGTQPAGFTYALGCTAASGRTAAAGDVYGIRHRIEGYNSAQLSFGTSQAQPAVLSFWVRSSVTGTYNVGFFNGAANRSLVSSYVVNTANTWEYKTIYINGDSSGTWDKTNGTGLEIFWDLGTGSTYNASSLNTWLSGVFVTSSSSTKWIATTNATFYLTGVQLEQNLQPTPFEQRPIGIELELCQRYYEKSYSLNVSPGTNSYVGTFEYTGGTQGSNLNIVTIQFKTPKRTTSYTVTGYTGTGLANQWEFNRSGSNGFVTVNFDRPSTTNFRAYVNAGAGWVVCQLSGHWTVDAEL
jgi:hypothetical protein